MGETTPLEHQIAELIHSIKNLEVRDIDALPTPSVADEIRTIERNVPREKKLDVLTSYKDILERRNNLAQYLVFMQGIQDGDHDNATSNPLHLYLKLGFNITEEGRIPKDVAAISKQVKKMSKKLHTDFTTAISKYNKEYTLNIGWIDEFRARSEEAQKEINTIYHNIESNPAVIIDQITIWKEYLINRRKKHHSNRQSTQTTEETSNDHWPNFPTNLIGMIHIRFTDPYLADYVIKQAKILWGTKNYSKFLALGSQYGLDNEFNTAWQTAQTQATRRTPETSRPKTKSRYDEQTQKRSKENPSSVDSILQKLRGYQSLGILTAEDFRTLDSDPTYKSLSRTQKNQIPGDDPTNRLSCAYHDGVSRQRKRTRGDRASSYWYDDSFRGGFTLDGISIMVDNHDREIHVAENSANHLSRVLDKILSDQTKAQEIAKSLCSENPRSIQGLLERYLIPEMKKINNYPIGATIAMSFYFEGHFVGLRLGDQNIVALDNHGNITGGIYDTTNDRHPGGGAILDNAGLPDIFGLQTFKIKADRNNLCLSYSDGIVKALNKLGYSIDNFLKLIREYVLTGATNPARLAIKHLLAILYAKYGEGVMNQYIDDLSLSIIRAD